MNFEDYVEEKAEEAAGNWMQFQDFAWHTQPDDAENWCIINTSDRDTVDIRTQSNEAVLEKEMEPFLGNGDCTILHCRHWAVGFTKGFAIRVKDAEGNITDAFRKWCENMMALEDYPVLDDTDNSQREFDAQHEAIEENEPMDSPDDLPEDWAHQVWEYFWASDQLVLEFDNDGGSLPLMSREKVREALVALELMNDDEEDDEDDDAND